MLWAAVILRGLGQNETVFASEEDLILLDFGLEIRFGALYLLLCGIRSLVTIIVIFRGEGKLPRVVTSQEWRVSITYLESL